MAEHTSGNGGDRPRRASPARQSHGADAGWAITGTLLSGMIVWGGAGWLLDRWVETRAFFPIGVVLGLVVAIYVVVVKYGVVDPPADQRPTGTTPDGRRSRPGTQKGQR